MSRIYLGTVAAMIAAHDTYRILRCPSKPTISREDEQYAYFNVHSGATLCSRYNDGSRVHYEEREGGPCPIKVPKPDMNASTAVWIKARTLILPAYLLTSNNLYLMHK